MQYSQLSSSKTESIPSSWIGQSVEAFSISLRAVGKGLKNMSSSLLSSFFPWSSERCWHQYKICSTCIGPSISTWAKARWVITSFLVTLRYATQCTRTKVLQKYIIFVNCYFLIQGQFREQPNRGIAYARCWTIHIICYRPLQPQQPPLLPSSSCLLPP